MTNELQNVALQHANINNFVQNYSLGIHVNAQAIVRGLPQEKLLMRFSSMSRSIGLPRPYKPTEEDINVINMLPRVCALQGLIQKRKQARDTIRALGNKKNMNRQTRNIDVLSESPEMRNSDSIIAGCERISNATRTNNQ